jgi:hypothetical protein
MQVISELPGSQGELIELKWGIDILQVRKNMVSGNGIYNVKIL